MNISTNICSAFRLRFYEDKQVGNLMSNVVNDTDLFEQFIAHAIPDVVVNLVTLVGVSVVLFSLNWKLTLFSLIPIPLVFLSLRVYAKYVRPAFRNRQKVLGDLNALLNDNLSGIREIKAFTREAEEAKRVHAGIENYRKSQLSALKLMATFQPFVEFTSSLGTLIVIYFGGRLACIGSLPGGRPGGILPLPAEFLRPGAEPERRLGGHPVLSGGRGPGGGPDRRAARAAESPRRRAGDRPDRWRIHLQECLALNIPRRAGAGEHFPDHPGQIGGWRWSDRPAWARPPWSA